MQQLSAQDASFLYLESSATPMHVGSISIYDGSDTDDSRLTEEAILRSVGDRLHLAVTTRRRCIRVPLDADYPYWIEDADFDLEYHIRRVALPKPADWTELKKLSARIFSRPLDMNKPLWEFYIIEGLDHLEGIPRGSFALLSKTHHAAIDGASGMHFFELMHDLAPQPTPVPMPQTPWRPDPMPTAGELLFRTGINNFQQPLRIAQAWARQFKQNTQSFESFTAPWLASRREFNHIPKTRFNGKVTSHRVLGTVAVSLKKVRKIRKMVAGATVNDVVLAICSGALRSYLDSKNELSKDSLIAMAPVNVRTDEDSTSQGGNKVSALFVAIATNEESPRQRLLKIHEETAASKLMQKAIGAAAMTNYGDFVPAFTAALASRLMAQTAANAPTPPFNVSITNVPGPQIPLYFCGAPMVSTIGIGPITQGMGLIFPVMSYCGKLSISFTSCREMIPDPDFFESCIESAYKELLDEAKDNQNE